jgi:fluoride exporter
MKDYLLVAMGGALGSVARFWLTGFSLMRFGTAFPIGTLIVNVTGSFAIGLFAGFTSPGGAWQMHASWRNLFIAGVFGGYTTFSSFSLQTLALAQNGEWFRAGANIVLSVALSLAAVWTGNLLVIWIQKS